MIEVLLVVFTCAFGVAAIRTAQGRTNFARPIVMLAISLPAMPCGLAWLAISHREMTTAEPAVAGRPVEEAHSGFVGSDACMSCHPQEHFSWHNSYHRSMTQVASAKSVVGDFENTTLRLGAASFHLTHDADSFMAEIQMSVPSGNSENFVHATQPIVMTTGSHHQQSYWFSLNDATRGVALFPFAYLIDQQRWVPRGSIFLQPRSRVAQYEAGLWNQNCIKCHSTGALPRANHFVDGNAVYSDRMDTKVAEFGIACESCHGPGERHCQVNRDPVRRYGHHLVGAADDSISNPARMSHQFASQVCGQCHGIFDFYSHASWGKWNERGFGYRPGQDLADSKIRFYVNCSGVTDTEGISGWYGADPRFFWSDGMPRTSGREFNSLVRSACYERGTLSCLSCHKLHQDSSDGRDVKEWADGLVGPGMDGNDACLSCHSDLKSESNLVAHTHHSAESSGSNCYNCHMPYTTYGLLKAIRSHEINSPSVPVTLQTGRPTACNLCHLDQTLQWTSNWMSEWYGSGNVEIPAEHQETASSIVWMLRGDAGQRALAAWACGWPDAVRASGSDWMAPFLAQLLEDPYDAVRLVAERSLRRMPETELGNYDFLDTDENVARVHQRVLDAWRERRSGTQAVEKKRVLIDGNGRLMQSEFEQLLESRDDTPISLLE